MASGEAEPLLLSIEAGASSIAADNNNNDHHPTPSNPSTQQQQQTIQMRWVVAAHLLCLIAILLVVWWIHLLGGFSWQTGHTKQVFNWHPFLMMIAFAFITIATLSFRTNLLCNNSSNRSENALFERHNQQKWIHGMAWLIAALCIIVSLMAVFKSHNDPVSGYTANLYSLHSWMGMMVLLIYVLQFSIGVVAFWKPIAYFTPARKQRILQIHKTVGPLVYYTITLTILLGIQEKEKFVVCSYPVVDRPDWPFPFTNINRLPMACRISHVLAFVIFFTAVCTSQALSSSSSQQQHQYSDDDRPSETNPTPTLERDRTE